jgi:hypothetical protein
MSIETRTATPLILADQSSFTRSRAVVPSRNSRPPPLEAAFLTALLARCHDYCSIRDDCFNAYSALSNPHGRGNASQRQCLASERASLQLLNNGTSVKMYNVDKQARITAFIKGLFQTLDHCGISDEVDAQDRADIENYCRRELEKLL